LPQGEAAKDVWDDLYKFAESSISWSDGTIDKDFFINEGSKIFQIHKIVSILPNNR
jgi:hypothetical protein